jgi:hypothetical protein
MIDMKKILENSAEELNTVSSLYDSLYQDKFAPYFEGQHNLAVRLKSKFKPISDEELEDILTTTPLNLYAVSEELNRFRLNVEVIKLKVKSYETQLKAVPKDNDEAYLQISDSLIENKLLCAVYDKVVLRVEGEISFSRELIMSAKKIWDGRRDTVNANPLRVGIAPDDTYDNLPVY